MSAVAGNSKKSESRIEAERKIKQRVAGLRISRVEIHGKGGLTFARIKRKTPIVRSALHSNQVLLFGFRHSRYRAGGGPDGQVVSIKNRRRWKCDRVVIDEKNKS